MNRARFEDDDARPEKFTDEWAVAHAESLRIDDGEPSFADEHARIAAQSDPETEAYWRALIADAERDIDDRMAAHGITREDLYPAPVERSGDARTVDADRLYRGARFVLDDEPAIASRVGTDDRVLWASGEALMICAPPGVGKTTVALQLVSAMIGADGAELFGLPVQPASRVLYLAMDRPRQIQRAMRRLWTEAHRGVLDDRLAVWKGPLPFDFGDTPTGLLDLARSHGADVVVVDSLKDAAVELTNDRVGGMVNRSIQTCLAGDVDVLVLHHQRKGQNGEKPKRLEDVYGSTWLTAGMGSVVLLWGAAGDPIVELVHLKQPAAEIGPFKVEHDHTAGRSTIYSGFDLDRFLSTHPRGVTAIEVARAMTEKTAPNDNERKKAQRLLDAAVKKGRLTKEDAVIGGVGGAQGARYHAVEMTLLVAS